MLPKLCRDCEGLQLQSVDIVHAKLTLCGPSNLWKLIDFMFQYILHYQSIWPMVCGI